MKLSSTDLIDILSKASKGADLINTCTTISILVYNPFPEIPVIKDAANNSNGGLNVKQLKLGINQYILAKIHPIKRSFCEEFLMTAFAQIFFSFPNSNSQLNCFPYYLL